MPGTTSTALPSFSHDQHHKQMRPNGRGGGGVVVSREWTLWLTAFKLSNKTTGSWLIVSNAVVPMVCIMSKCVDTLR